jgi:hypothetical protein
MFLLCLLYKDSSMEHKVTWRRTEGFKVQNGSKERKIPPGAWMSVCCDCCVLSGRGLCDGLVPRPEESHRVWCV